MIFPSIERIAHREFQNRSGGKYSKYRIPGYDNWMFGYSGCILKTEPRYRKLKFQDKFIIDVICNSMEYPDRDFVIGFYQ
jgi:hypothetical protein